MKNEPAFLVPGVWLLLATAVFAVAMPRIDDLGLYYDEAFLAQQGRDFVEPQRAGMHPPSVTTTYIAGRPFPVRNAAYLGSLKSQLVIPTFFAFGANTKVLRATTLAIGLFALLFCMLLAKQWFGARVAVATGVLIATDPSFYFFSQFEWGPFTSMLLCRGAGLYCISRAFHPEATNNRWAAVVCGAVLLGLGVYSRVDFAVILAGAATALVACRRDLIASAVQERRGMLIAGALVFAVAVTPVLAVVGQVLGAGAGIADRGDLGYRIQVLLSTLDGSHFYRLIHAGGLFDRMFAEPGPTTALPILLLAGVAITWLLARRSDTQRKSAIGFLWVATLFITVVMLAIPGAVRAHHMLNLLPFVHMIVAIAGVGLWDASWSSQRSRALARMCVAVAAGACIYSNAVAIATTRELIQDTGGIGRFSHARQDLIRKLDASPDAAATQVVSLDWGFHEIALFESHNLVSTEPIWSMGKLARRQGGFIFDGNASTVYLLHAPPYDLFGYSERFAQALPGIDPTRYEMTDHRDRRGDLVFKSARFDAPHRMTFDGTFRIRLSAAATPPRAPAEQP